MSDGRSLTIPNDVPEDFAQSVVTILLFGVAGKEVWEPIYWRPPDTSLKWIKEILDINDQTGFVHPKIEWWELQLRGH